MKKDTPLTPAATAAFDQPTTPAPVIVRVRVLTSRLLIAGGCAAKNAVVSCTEAAAKYHEDRGEVQILGTL